MEDREIERITIHYDDGTTEEATKGIMITEEPGKDDTQKETFYPVGSVTTALIQYADRLGVFDNIKEKKNE